MIFPINVTLVNASVTDLIGIMITNSSKVHNCQDTQYIQTTSLGMMRGMATFLTEASESVFRSAALCWDGHPFPSLPICLSSHSSLCMIPTFQKCYRLELHNFFLTATIIPLVIGYKDIKIISLSLNILNNWSVQISTFNHAMWMDTYQSILFRCVFYVKVILRHSNGCIHTFFQLIYRSHVFNLHDFSTTFSENLKHDRKTIFCCTARGRAYIGNKYQQLCEFPITYVCRNATESTEVIKRKSIAAS